MWCKYYVHRYVNGKMIPVEYIPRIEGARIGKNNRGR
jgi:hypothetical protein